MEQVIRDDERGKGLGPSAVGLQCGGRTLADFRADLDAGVRDAVALHNGHVLVVRTPRRPGLGLAVKAVFRGAASVVPHERIPRRKVSAAEIVDTPPPAWNLVSDFAFLRIATDSGDNWHWIDRESMQGKLERFEQALAMFVSATTTTTG